MKTFNYEAAPIDVSDMKKYKKKDLLLHMIRTADLNKDGETIVVSTMEGDISVKAGPETYIMIGPANDKYPISKETFDSRYVILNPESPELVKECRLKNDSFVLVKQINEPFIVITRVLGNEVTMNGKAGDYLTRTYHDETNFYILDQEMLKLTYSPCE